MKPLEERVFVTHQLREGVSLNVVLYDKPRSPQLVEVATFPADGPEQGAAYYFRQGFIAGCKESASPSG
jgi:tRNA pseudouridine-54 N-methylase